MNEILFIAPDGNLKLTTKENILDGLKSFDNRESDKTFSLWTYMAEYLYKNQELKIIKNIDQLKTRNI